MAQKLPVNVATAIVVTNNTSYEDEYDYPTDSYQLPSDKISRPIKVWAKEMFRHV